MAEQKTRPTAASVSAFIEKVPDETRRQDCRTLLRLMKRVARTEPKMWGAGMVGFGEYHYKYPSGHEGDCFLVGFAPRKTEITLYITCGLELRKAQLARLGRHRARKACLYIKRLADVDLSVLEELIGSSLKEMKKRQA